MGTDQGRVATRSLPLWVADSGGAHRVPEDLALLRALDGFFERSTARVVVSVADDHERPGHRLGFRPSGEFVSGEGNRIPQSGASSRSKLVDGMRHSLAVAGKVLHQQHRVGDAHHERQVMSTAKNLLQEMDGRALLEGESTANRLAG